MNLEGMRSRLYFSVLSKIRYQMGWGFVNSCVFKLGIKEMLSSDSHVSMCHTPFPNEANAYGIVIYCRRPNKTRRRDPRRIAPR